MRFVISFVMSLAVSLPLYGATPLYVDPTAANDTGDGTTPATAKKTIEAAYSAVDDGGSVYLLGGTYDATTQGATWYLAIDNNKSVTIKPDPTTTPSINLLTNGATYCLYYHTCSAGKTIRIEGVTITPQAGSRIGYFSTAFYGSAELVNCVLVGGTRNIICQASQAAPFTRTLLMDGCTYTTSNNQAIAPRAFNTCTVKNCTITSGSVSNASTDGVFVFYESNDTVVVKDNAITCAVQSVCAFTGTSWTSFWIDGNTIAFTPVDDTVECMYFRDDAIGSRGNIVISDNTIAVASGNATIIRVGLETDFASAVAYPAPVVIGNQMTTSNLGYGTAISFGAGVSNGEVAFNDLTGFRYGIQLYGCFGACVDANYIEGGQTEIILQGGGNHRITHNHVIARDYGGATEPGRCFLGNRIVKATSTTTTAYAATTVTDTGGTPWGSAQASIVAGLVAMVNAGTEWYSPLQWARVVSINGNEVTVDGWQKWDGSGDAETPTNGNVCKIMQFPLSNVLTDNVFDGGRASYGFTFDFIPIDPLTYCDRNIYRAGTSTLTNLASHILVGGDPTNLAELQSAWAAISPSQPYNDAHSQEAFFDTSHDIGTTRWWRMPGWQMRVRQRGRMLPL